jgi:hypothetical protein
MVVSVASEMMTVTAVLSLAPILRESGIGLT